MEFYLNPIPQTLYRKLNKDRSVNYHFKSDNVGKCAELFDKFMEVGVLTKKNWELFYFGCQSKEPLQKAAEFISDKYNIDIVLAKKYVRFRVLGQTWNGMMTELRIIDELQDELNLDFRKTPYEIDEQYFTDWEAYQGKLLFGIQIKPISYKMMSTPYQLKAKENHNKQRDEYKARFKVPHIIIYYKDGKIYDKERVLDQINTILFYNIEII